MLLLTVRPGAFHAGVDAGTGEAPRAAGQRATIRATLSAAARAGVRTLALFHAPVAGWVTPATDWPRRAVTRRAWRCFSARTDDAGRLSDGDGVGLHAANVSPSDRRPT